MKKKLIIPIVLLISFIIIMTLVLTNNITEFDNGIYNFLIDKRCSSLDFLFTNVTKLGNTITVICIMSVLLITLNNINRIMLTINIFFTTILNQMVKYIIQRPRPEHLRLIKQGGYSFPSGHAMISIALYGFLIYVTNKKVKNKYIKILLNILLISLIMLIGLSRIYVGVHYPSDVLAGYLFALVILYTTIIVSNKIRGNINDKNDSK